MWIGAEAGVLEGPQEETELAKWVGLAGVWQLQTGESTKRRRSFQARCVGGRRQRRSVPRGDTRRKAEWVNQDRMLEE